MHTDIRKRRPCGFISEFATSLVFEITQNLQAPFPSVAPTKKKLEYEETPL